MKPVGLTFKSEGGKKQGELCVVTQCEKCTEVSKNRIAADDEYKKLVEVFRKSWGSIDKLGINLLKKEDGAEVITQLFGRPNLEKYLPLLRD